MLHRARAARAQSAAATNRSLINGVQFGLQPFCYHDLAMTRENRGELIRRLVRNGMGMVELHATWVEPRFDDPGVSTRRAREAAQWRLHPPAGYYQGVRKELDDAGVVTCSRITSTSTTATPTRKSTPRSKGQDPRRARLRRLVWAGRVAAARAVSRPARHVRRPAQSRQPVRSRRVRQRSQHGDRTVDVAGLQDDARRPSLHRGRRRLRGFLERHHDRVAGMHVGDRRKHNGRSAPFGEGDAPIIELLRMVRDNRWPIVALLEFEHGTLRPEVEEVDLMFDYCKRAVA